MNNRSTSLDDVVVELSADLEAATKAQTEPVLQPKRPGHGLAAGRRYIEAAFATTPRKHTPPEIVLLRHRRSLRQNGQSQCRSTGCENLCRSGRAPLSSRIANDTHATHARSSCGERRISHSELPGNADERNLEHLKLSKVFLGRRTKMANPIASHLRKSGVVPTVRDWIALNYGFDAHHRTVKHLGTGGSLRRPRPAGGTREVGGID